MLIKYGIQDNNIDITDICFKKLLHNDIIVIPSSDFRRSAIFTDPLINVLKEIFIISEEKVFTFDQTKIIKINAINNSFEAFNDEEISNCLYNIHSKLKINHGSFNDELPEQKMAFTYLTGDEKILEIGGNVGRNSLVIAHILSKKNNNNLLTLESDTNICNQLQENRDLNNMNFYIENFALSKRKLIQKGWDTIPSDELFDGWHFVNTITMEELNTKYNIPFDTLVLDCEGAFYTILMDMPEILNNINLIIMENDYHSIEHKNYIDNELIKNNFFRVYVEDGAWGIWPCNVNFYEVWKR